MSGKSASADAPSNTGLVRGHRRRITIGALAGASYFACASLGYAFVIRPSSVVVWPGAGLLLAMLLLLDIGDWPAVLGGAFLANVVADLMHHSSPLVAVAGSGANCLESIVAAWLLIRLVGPRPTFGTLRQVAGFILVAALASNALTALVGALVVRRGSLEGFGRGWLAWWAGDGIGMLMVAPAILTVAALVRTRAKPSPALAIEAAVSLVAVAALAQVLLSGQHDSNGVIAGPAYMVFPLLIWIAVRIGPWGAAAATFILCCVTAWNASHITGLFGNVNTSMRQVFDMYSYLALASLSSLVPAAILNERLTAEAELRSSEGRFRQMAEHINEAFFILELPTGQPLYASPTWSDIWGRPMEAAAKRETWSEALHPDDRPLMRESLEAIKHGEARTATFRVVRPDGSRRWVRGRGYSVRDDTGAVYRLVGVAEDITELRQTEERLGHAQKMDAIGRLAGGVAHDFNNLLTVILSHSDMVLSEMPARDPQREDISAIQSAATSAAALTRQLLAFSRQDVLKPRPLGLNALVADTGKMLTRLIGTNIKLVMSLNAIDDTVMADPGQIEQVIVNLAVNARDAMPRGGRLLIESRDVTFHEAIAGQDAVLPAGSYVMLAFSDSGVGMDAETRSHVFEPFFTTKDPGKGTGLGLWTVYALVQQSRGFITVYSEPGKGSNFKVYLPHTSEPTTRTDELAASSAPPRGTETVLVVEDDVAVRAILGEVLERYGYRVLAMSDGASAVELVARHQGPIDLLVTDVMMPAMGGQLLAENFSARRPHGKILFVSGYTDDAVLRHGILAAGVNYLEKPFTATMLARKVRQVLDSPLALAKRVE